MSRDRRASWSGKGALLTLRLISRAGPAVLARFILFRTERGRCFGSQVIRTPGRPMAPIRDPAWPTAHCLVTNSYHNLVDQKPIQTRKDFKPKPDFCDVCAVWPLQRPPCGFSYTLVSAACGAVVDAGEKVIRYAGVDQRRHSIIILLI